MNRMTPYRLGRALVAVVAVALTAACDDGGLGPDYPTMPEAQLAATTGADADIGLQDLDLGTCDNLSVPEGSKLAFHVYAEGVQIYRWDGGSWKFQAPSAMLFADAEGNSTIGSHYGGPTWESVSGGTVMGSIRARCISDPTAVDWLLLDAVPTETPGIFRHVTFIQRVNTMGGVAPSDPGTFVGEEARMPYTTEYLFYRGE